MDLAGIMSVIEADLERSPDFWWLRLKYAIRNGREDEAAEALRRLKELGVEVRLTKPRAADSAEGQP